MRQGVVPSAPAPCYEPSGAGAAGRNTRERAVSQTQPARPAPSAPGAVDYGLLVGLALLWGASFPLIKIAVASIPPISMSAGRLGVAALALLVLVAVRGERLPRGARVWGLIVAAAVTGNALPFALISWGEEVIDSGIAAILMAVMPLSTALLAHVFTRDEKLSWRKAFGVGCGIVGVVVLIGPEKLAGLGHDAVRQLAVAGAAVCYSVNALITRRLAGQPQRPMVASVMLVATLIISAAAFLLEDPLAASPSSGSLAAMVGLGLVQTALATLMLFAIVGRQGASFFSQINFLVPLFGVLLGALWLGERPPAQALAALLVILLGIAVARSSMRSR